KSIGYDARPLRDSPNVLSDQEHLEGSPVVALILKDVPPEVKNEESQHLVMLGYTSEGQANLLVCSINPNVLHIRVRDDLFDKLRRACKEICTNVWKHEKIVTQMSLSHKIVTKMWLSHKP